ncbi:MAG: S8 family serine peptidase [Chitinophagaceae bacterium]|nr:S8 family serine peptidase [Chitinophagaceae bacterium]
MKQFLLLLIAALCIAPSGFSQAYSKRVVFFTNKDNTPFTLSNPSAYLTARAIDRRTRYSIAIDSTDIPVLQRYVDSVRLAGAVTILGRSKWLNAVIIQTTDAAAIAKINAFPFVKKSDTIALRINTTAQPVMDKFGTISTPSSGTAARITQSLGDTFNYGASSNQIKIHTGEFLHNIGARGQTMVMAFLDAGFTNFQTNRFFDSARARNQFLGTWDFVQNSSNVNSFSGHGLNCFSIVASYIPGTFVGTCPEAKYYLLRTEDAPTEQIIEEYNWVMGAEYADSAGVDVISSSLGYTTFDNPVFNHTYAQMNGNTTVVTRGADMAAKKGMLVVNSAGNDGNNSWKFIGAPADGDSVLTVGAVNSSGIIASFSSFGPTSDGRIKPDVVSVGSGTVLSDINGNVSSGNGTSFSCPNLAGLATCLWQLFPEYNNWKIITTLRKASDRFSVPHEQYGYGLPDMKKAVGFLLADVSSMNALVNNCTSTINWTSKDISTMRYDIERKLPGETVYTKIKSIPAKGIVFSAQSYQTTDMITSSPAGTVNYRIQQVIDTSAAGFSSVAIDSASVILNGACSATSVIDISNIRQRIKLYPNPIAEKIYLSFTDGSKLDNLTIQLFSVSGQLVLKQNYNKPNGNITLPIDLSPLQKGNYILQIIKDGKLYAVKEFAKQ